MKKLITLFVAFIAMASFKHEGPGYHVGDKAADFKLKNVDGKMVSMADYNDAKGFIVVFTCNHCPFAIKYEDRINALDKKYKKAGYPVIAINPNDPATHAEDSYENMQKRAKQKKFSFPYLLDDTQATATAYGAAKTPHIYIVQKEGDGYVVRYIGAIDDNSDNEKEVKEKYAEKAIDNLLAGKPVDPSLTKAVGCTIKWKKA